MPQEFDQILPDSGGYDRRLRDAESIGDLEVYLTEHSGDFSRPGRTAQLQAIDACVQSVAAIREMCDEAGVELFVVLSPVYAQQLEAYDPESLNLFFRQLAQEVDYWNFSISSISYDARYFMTAIISAAPWRIWCWPGFPAVPTRTVRKRSDSSVKTATAPAWRS